VVPHHGEHYSASRSQKYNYTMYSGIEIFRPIFRYSTTVFVVLVGGLTTLPQNENSIYSIRGRICPCLLCRLSAGRVVYVVWWHIQYILNSEGMKEPDDRYGTCAVW